MVKSLDWYYEDGDRFVEEVVNDRSPAARADARMLAIVGKIMKDAGFTQPEVERVIGDLINATMGREREAMSRVLSFRSDKAASE